MKLTILFRWILAFVPAPVGCRKKELSLHEAAAAGDIQQVRLLISRRADVNTIRSSRYTPRHETARHNYKDMAELLINNGAHVDAQRQSGATPLHDGVLRDRRNVAGLLLASSADVNARGNRGRTPLFCAKDSAHKDMYEFLWAHGAKP